MSYNAKPTHYAWDTYAEQLFPQGHGYPLWMPDPDPSAGEVEIADVGWIDQGGFFQLFNPTRNDNDRQVQGAVPRDFEPLDPSALRIAGPHQRITQRCVYSRTVEDFKMSGNASVGWYVALVILWSVADASSFCTVALQTRLPRAHRSVSNAVPTPALSSSTDPQPTHARSRRIFTSSTTCASTLIAGSNSPDRWGSIYAKRIYVSYTERRRRATGLSRLSMATTSKRNVRSTPL